MHVTLAGNFPYDCHAVTDGGICWSPWRAKEHPHEASTMGAVVSVLATNPPPESKTSNDSAENVIALPLGRASRTSLMITWEFQVSRGVCTSDAAHHYYWGWAEGFMSASNWGRIAAGRDSKDLSAAPGLPNAVRWIETLTVRCIPKRPLTRLFRTLYETLADTAGSGGLVWSLAAGSRWCGVAALLKLVG